jgi:hypothetical protein
MNDRDELRSSLGAPRYTQIDSTQSKFKRSFENYIYSLPIDTVWQLGLIGLIWPVSVFYLSSTLIGAIIFEVLFFTIVLTQGWPGYLFIAFFCFGAAAVNEEFSELNRWYRAAIWGGLALVLGYIFFPFDVRSHEKNIMQTSSNINLVTYPRFGDDLNAPTIFIDESFTPTLSSLLDNFIKQVDFRKEFEETCLVSVAAGKEGSGAWLWKETYDEIIFSFADGRSLELPNCDAFTEPITPELTAKFEPTWSTPNSIDAWGRIDFPPGIFNNADSPSGTVIEVLFSNSLTDQNFKVVGSFQVAPDPWWGEVVVKLNKPVLGKLRLPAQNGLPETFSEVFRVIPNKG